MSLQGKVISIHNNLPLRMHATPFLEARVVSRLPVGVVVDIEAVEGSWMCVYDRATGHSGWVDRKYIHELPQAQPDCFPAPFDTDPVEPVHLRRLWQICGAVLLFGVAFIFILALIGGI